MKRPAQPHFGHALRTIRLARGLTQEEFDAVSGRTYISQLERDVKQPTLEKLSHLATVLDVHPLTLAAASFLGALGPKEVRALLSVVEGELIEVGQACAP